MKTSVIEYIDLLYERLGKLAFEEIEYSDYDEMTDWLAEIREEVKWLEKRDVPMKPVYDHRYAEMGCAACGNFVGGWEQLPDYCPQCGQAIDWGEE